MVRKKQAQIKIQQMAFMIVGVLFFFVLVGIFFIGWQYKSVIGSFEDLQKEQALASLKVIANMPELNCDSRQELCVDLDKVEVMTRAGSSYRDFWPIASVEFVKLYPAFNKTIRCPAQNCNYYEVYNSGQKNLKKTETYVSLCRKIKENDYVYDKCELGKLYLGVKLVE